MLFLACLLPHEGMSPSTLMPKEVCLHIERRLQSPQDTSGCVNVLVGKVQALSQASQLPNISQACHCNLKGMSCRGVFVFAGLSAFATLKVRPACLS